MTASPTRVQTLNENDYQKYRVPEELGSFGSLETPQGHLPLTAMELSGRVTGLVYQLKLRQRFYNVHSQPLEAVYIFPLPARSAVGSFVMQTRDRRVVGTLEERGKARQQYQQAIAQGKQAALAEEDRSEVFTMTVGNIPPHQWVEVELEIDGPLSWADGQAMFRFPLVVAPRYIPGTPYPGESVGAGTSVDTDAVPDASRISPPVLLPGYPNPVRFSVEIDVDLGGLRATGVSLSLPELTCSDGPHGYRIQLDPGQGKLNRDLIVRWEISDQDIQSSLLVQSVSPEEHYALLNLIPDQNQLQPAQPRQLVALLDRSGSMEGWKMVCARRALGRLVDSLVDCDSFQVLNFDTVVELLDPKRSGLLPATDRTRYLTLEKLAGVEARGGTEILHALEEGVKLLRDHPNPCLLLITDGQVGNESEVLRWVQTEARGIRIFCVGIDQAVNVSLLERLAQVSNGHFTLVESEDQLDQAMHGLQQRINPPLLENVQLDSSSDAAPARVHLFSGLGTRLLARLQGPLPESLRVRATARDGSAWERALTPQPCENGIRKIWARERLLELEHGFLAGWSDAAYQAPAITQFSLLHQVLCRFTAFVAVDQQSQVEGPLKQVVQAVEAPEGWEMQAPGSGMLKKRVLASKPMLGGAPRMAMAPPPPPSICAAPAPAPDPFAGGSPFLAAPCADPFGAPAADPFAAPTAAEPFSSADPFVVAQEPEPFCEELLCDTFREGGEPFQAKAESEVSLEELFQRLDNSDRSQLAHTLQQLLDRLTDPVLCEALRALLDLVKSSQAALNPDELQHIRQEARRLQEIWSGTGSSRRETFWK